MNDTAAKISLISYFQTLCPEILPMLLVTAFIVRRRNGKNYRSHGFVLLMQRKCLHLYYVI
jgi:hypothetical protein